MSALRTPDRVVDVGRESPDLGVHDLVFDEGVVGEQVVHLSSSVMGPVYGQASCPSTFVSVESRIGNRAPTPSPIVVTPSKLEATSLVGPSTIPRHLRCEYYDGTVLCPDGQRIQLHYVGPTQTPGRWPEPKPGDPPPY